MRFPQFSYRYIHTTAVGWGEEVFLRREAEQAVFVDRAWVFCDVFRAFCLALHITSFAASIDVRRRHAHIADRVIGTAQRQAESVRYEDQAI